jgi:putative SOS response-associated peptidase YedK
MCGRYANAETTDELALRFNVDIVGENLPAQSWNIKPTQIVPVIAESAAGTDTVSRRLESARWSLIPPWVTDGKPKFSTFNARSEEAASKASWKASVKSKRCLVPASGYYEWVTEGSTKTPFYICGEEPLAFAGLYSWWRASESDPWLLTATIMTMASVPELARIHDRNPMALPARMWNDWLDPTIEGDQTLIDAAAHEAQTVARTWRAHEVAPLRGDGPELILPV